MAEITRMLAAKNTRRQFFFVIATTTSIRCLVQNFQLICYVQRLNATWKYDDSGSLSFSKSLNIGWPQWRITADFLYKEKEASEKDDKRLLLNWCWAIYWHVQ